MKQDGTEQEMSGPWRPEESDFPRQTSRAPANSIWREGEDTESVVYVDVDGRKQMFHGAPGFMPEDPPSNIDSAALRVQRVQAVSKPSTGSEINGHTITEVEVDQEAAVEPKQTQAEISSFKRFMTYGKIAYEGAKHAIITNSPSGFLGKFKQKTHELRDHAQDSKGLKKAATYLGVAVVGAVTAYGVYRLLESSADATTTELIPTDQTTPLQEVAQTPMPPAQTAAVATDTTSISSSVAAEVWDVIDTSAQSAGSYEPQTIAHVVSSGDTLSTVVRDHLLQSDPAFFENPFAQDEFHRIVRATIEANEQVLGDNPDLIFPGETLTIIG